MQFGFTNALVTFQKRINSVLAEHLNEFVMAYLDNIIIYSNSEEEHYEYIEQVLEQLNKAEIPIAIEKCEFLIRRTDFVGFIIELERISIDLKKVEAINNQQELENVTQLRLFLGFCNYYRRFITQQLKNIKPFTRLIKKDELQQQGKEQRELFKKLKQLFTEGPILKIY